MCRRRVNGGHFTPKSVDLEPIYFYLKVKIDGTGYKKVG